jgi:hypothetical protein
MSVAMTCEFTAHTQHYWRFPSHTHTHTHTAAMDVLCTPNSLFLNLRNVCVFVCVDCFAWFCIYACKGRISHRLTRLHARIPKLSMDQDPPLAIGAVFGYQECSQNPERWFCTIWPVCVSGTRSIYSTHSTMPITARTASMEV